MFLYIDCLEYNSPCTLTNTTKQPHPTPTKPLTLTLNLNHLTPTRPHHNCRHPSPLPPFVKLSLYPPVVKALLKGKAPELTTQCLHHYPNWQDDSKKLHLTNNLHRVQGIYRKVYFNYDKNELLDAAGPADILLVMSTRTSDLILYSFTENLSNEWDTALLYWKLFIFFLQNSLFRIILEM